MNIGHLFANGVGMRAAGSNHNGQTFGGVYYPAHTKNGKAVAGRWEGMIFINRPAYTDAAGVKHEGKSEIIRLVVWNAKTSAPGKGLADSFAKCISVGKEISAELDINTFDKRMFLNGTLLVDTVTGNAVTYPAVNFRVDGHVMYGPDAEGTIAKEIAAYAPGQANFSSRPQYWNVQGHADNAAWKLIVQQRMAAVCNPANPNYGYARIVIPEGAVLLSQAQAMAGQDNGVGGSALNATNPTAAAEEILGGQGGNVNQKAATQENTLAL